jgi:hypothetical protein
MTLDGEGIQVGGAPAPQLRSTALVYPLKAVNVPLNVAELLAGADCEGLLISNV